MARLTPLLRSLSHADNGSATANSLVITRPSGVQNGDVLFVYINAASGSNGSGWSLASWTTIGPSFQSGSRTWGWLYHLVTDVSLEPASYTFSYTGTAGRVTGDILAYSKVDPLSIETTGATTSYYDASDTQTGVPGWIRSKPFSTTIGATVLYANSNNIAASYTTAPTATPFGYNEVVISSTAGDTNVARTVHWIGTKIASTTTEPAARVDWSFVAAGTAAHVVSFLGLDSASLPLHLGSVPILSLRAGTQPVLRLYRGTMQVWPESSVPPTEYVTEIHAYGDSLTAGFGIGANNSWPAQLDALLDDANVQNFGVSGHTSAEVAIRHGGLALDLTFPANTIPASGAATVTAPATAWGVTAFSIIGTVSDVTGTLSHASGQSGLNNTQWVFTRQGSGSAVNLGAPAQFRSNAANDKALIVLAGRNDIGQGADSNLTIQRVLDNYAAMIQYNTSGNFLVLGNTTLTNESATGMARVSAINSALASTYGSRYLDINDWLINNGLSALDITPTSEDTDNIAAGKLPPSLMIDTIHWSAPVAALVAQQIKEKITALGWISSSP